MQTPVTDEFPEEQPPKKPTRLSDQLSRAWDYLANQPGKVCRVEQFDEDHAPIGPKLRAQLAERGVRANTSGGKTIIFFG